MLTAGKSKNEAMESAVVIARGIQAPCPCNYPYIYHAPAVISYLWGMEYATVCNHLGVEELSCHDVSQKVIKYGTAGLDTYVVESKDICPSHRGCHCSKAQTSGNIMVTGTEGSDALVEDSITEGPAPASSMDSGIDVGTCQDVVTPPSDVFTCLDQMFAGHGIDLDYGLPSLDAEEFQDYCEELQSF